MWYQNKPDIVTWAEKAKKPHWTHKSSVKCHHLSRDACGPGLFWKDAHSLCRM